MARQLSRRQFLVGAAAGAAMLCALRAPEGTPSAPTEPGEAEALAAELRALASRITSLHGRLETRATFVDRGYASSEAWEETRYFAVGPEEFWFQGGEFVRRSQRKDLALLGARFRTPEGPVCATWVEPDPVTGSRAGVVQKGPCRPGNLLRSPLRELLPTPARGAVALVGADVAEGRRCRLLSQGSGRFWVASSPLAVLRYEWFDRKGNLAERRTFHEFESFGGGVRLPRRYESEWFGTDGSLLYRLTTEVVELAMGGDLRPDLDRLLEPVREG